MDNFADSFLGTLKKLRMTLAPDAEVGDLVMCNFLMLDFLSLSYFSILFRKSGP